MIVLISFLIIVIAAQAVYIAALQRSQMGVFGPTALMLRLMLYSALKIRVWVIGLDIRKMQGLNKVGSMSNTNALIGKLLAVLRKNDLVGQMYGDEFVIVGRYSPHGPYKALRRLLRRRDEINDNLPKEFRSALCSHSGGLIDGLHMAICVIDDTDDAYGAAKYAIDKTGPIKAGNETGDRATSGQPGTVILRLEGVKL